MSTQEPEPGPADRRQAKPDGRGPTSHLSEASAAASDGTVLDRLRRDFAGHRVWRSTRYDGRLGDWVATLHDPAAGLYPTVIGGTAEELRAALVAENERARRAVR